MVKSTNLVFLWFTVVAALMTVPAGAVLDPAVISEARSLRDRGEFEKATAHLQAAAEQSSGTLEPSERRQIDFEIERIRRIRLDYTKTRDQVIESLRKQIPDLSDEDFDRYEREGHLDTLIIDGQKLYVNASASNLPKRVPELRSRRKDRSVDGAFRKLYAHMKRVEAARDLTSSSLVLPQDFMVTYTLTVKAGAVPAGQTIRCWLPYARAFPFQAGALVLESDPARFTLAQPEADHRTIYLEKTAEDGTETRFMARFIFRGWARSHRPDPAAVLPYDKDSALYKHYTADRDPHLDLDNELLKQLNAEIVGNEANPLVAARKIHDWMCRNMVYQYAREYSTLDNISFYTASRRAGDCGQHAMFFIAMCRLNGIPARWQSGWENFEVTGNNMHDWTEIYVEPYGWMPVDTDMALNTLRYADNELDTTRAQELADWLFGNMDHFRLATNAEFGSPLYPPKDDFRSETVDFQRGEVESNGRNLYFDQWGYSMEFEPIPADAAAALVKSLEPPAAELPPLPESPEASVTTETVSTDAGATAPVETSQPVTVSQDAGATSAPAEVQHSDASTSAAQPEASGTATEPAPAPDQAVPETTGAGVLP